MKLFYNAILLFIGLNLKLSAQEITWTGAISTNWNIAGNWNPQVVPTSANSVVIYPGSANEPTLNSVTTVRGVMLQGQLTITALGGLTIHGNQESFYTIDIYGTLINNGTVRIENAPTGPGINTEMYLFDGGRIINSGTIYNRYFAFCRIPSNSFGGEKILNNASGKIFHKGSGVVFRFGGAGNLTNHGLITSDGGSLFNGLDGNGTPNQILNSGTMRTNSSEAFQLNESTSSLNNQACGIIDNGGGNIEVVSGTFTNNGVIETTGTMANSGTLDNPGVLKAASITGVNNTGLLIENSVYPNPIFSYGSGNSYVVNGIFTDTTATTAAGTFVAPNAFDPNSFTTNLFARVSNGTCTFTVPFTYDATPLPVTLTLFKGRDEGKSISLQWKTAAEQNNAGFEIEKSVDAVNFKKIGFVESRESRTYNFSDQNPFRINYYRLKQIDFSGGFEYSKVISVNGNPVQLSIYPNPAQNQLFVKHLEGETEMFISDNNGKLWINGFVTPTLPLDIRRLPSGLFLVRIGDKTLKLLIQR